ncbi:MAG: aminotransferase class IV [Flavobacterium sp.]|nr:aminotransferase class IV [Flavobacterium sp.]
MVNVNGEFVSGEKSLNADNRAFLLGDGVFETLKVVNRKILFFEDHYFRLMSAMRIVRMEIPMSFTMEVIENEILQTVTRNNLQSARVRFTVFRNAGGRYLPHVNDISYVLSAEAQPTDYSISQESYEVDLFKDSYISRQLLSTVKTTNRLINITAAIFASENDLQNCFLLNDAKNVAEAINGNIFMRTGNSVVTPPISDGCVNGVMRKHVLKLIKDGNRYEIAEAPISPFDLQKADEIFITNVISGIQPVSKYRKKHYENSLGMELQAALNAEINIVNSAADFREH